MNDSSYSYGFLVSTALLLLEHVAFYGPLRPMTGDTETRADIKVLVKFTLGVGAILIGCFVVRWNAPLADPFFTPVACSASGLVVAAAYGVRAAVNAAWVRGWLTGLADRGDIVDAPAREQDDWRP